MSVKVKDDRKAYDDMRNRLFRKQALLVGIPSAKGAEAHDRVTLLEIAIWNEFGTRTIPERSFLRSWFDQNEDRARQMLEVMAKSVIEGVRDWPQALDLVGLQIVGEIQEVIKNRIPPPNAAYTIKKKGSDVPLVDTGVLRASITHVVKGRDEE